MLLKSSSSTELETGVVSLPSRQRVGLLRFAGPDGLEIDVLEETCVTVCEFEVDSMGCVSALRYFLSFDGGPADRIPATILLLSARLSEIELLRSALSVLFRMKVGAIFKLCERATDPLTCAPGLLWLMTLAVAAAEELAWTPVLRIWCVRESRLDSKIEILSRRLSARFRLSFSVFSLSCRNWRVRSATEQSNPLWMSCSCD